MTFYKFILASAATGMTATVTLASSHETATDRPNVGTYDGITIEQGMTNASDENVVDELEQQDQALSEATTEAENVLAAAEPGADLDSVNGETIGMVVGLWTPEGSDGYPYVIVEINESADIPAEQLGFEVSALESTEVGALEYSNTIEHLREEVIEKIANMQ